MVLTLPTSELGFNVKENKMSTMMIAKSTKTLVAAIVLTGVSLALATSAFAAPRQAPPTQAEQAWMNRASNPDTNGF